MPHQEIPWKQIYDLSLQCCKYRSTKSFSVSLLREMNRLVPFDEAVVFYLNGNLKITDYYLYNINPKWMSLYLGYYSNADRGAYGLVQRDLDNLDGVYVLRAVRRGHPRLYPSAQSGQHTGLSDARRNRPYPHDLRA